MKRKEKCGEEKNAEKRKVRAGGWSRLLGGFMG
jgi:hypothetical protein